MKNISLIKNDFKNSTYKKHFHNTYSISIITKGECKFCVKNTKYTATKGSIRVINPYEIHEIYSSNWEHINLVLTAYFIRTVIKDINLMQKCDNIHFQTIIDDEKLAFDIQKLYKENDFRENTTAIKNIIAYMTHKYSYQNFRKQHLDGEKIKLQKAVSYMYQNANNFEITLDEIASFAKISKYYFIREFKKEFTLTPYKYIQNIKINNARRMLYFDMPLSQITQECGFFDQSHFIKTYKNFFGHTPSKIYKKQ